ncbi:histone acetyltransferase subunit [Cercophora newfieldiana]|uniref:Protein AF-9 homolog n=1 Tax=Cercophora newfieldiana TaxID=92897 RepID=A0AA40CR53_9PEZI|nr:histone acetyltransferase subunit [Cercophora newfieldiana]
MAPPAGKRVKGVQIFRPFIYGTTARPFDEKTNPKPPGVPDDHTHSWTVFVKGIDDVDITYWLRRVQFKLHESIPNHVRMIDGEKGKPFTIHETGWGEFEITIKLYYVPESGEKPQTLYHHLRLHPFGRTEEEKETMRLNGEVISWTYEEQIFNEPYEAFYDVLTSGAIPVPGSKVGGGKGKGAAAKGKEQEAQRSEGGVLERSAMIPMTNRPGQLFSRETEQVELKKLQEALKTVQEMTKKMATELEKKNQRMLELKAEGAVKTT